MALCNKKHYRKNSRNAPSVEIPHYYIAGCCIVDPMHEGGFELFLRSFYPYYHGKTYEESKHQKQTVVPDNILRANEHIRIS